MLGRSRADNVGPQRVLDAIGRSLAIIEFDAGGHVLTANDNFCRTMGYRLDEIRGRHHRLFVDPAYAETPDYAAFWRTLARGEYDAGEYRRVGRDGREVWIQASYNPVCARDGRLLKVVKVVADVTAQKLRALDVEARMSALSRVQAVIAFSNDGHVLEANENFLKVMGYTLPEIVGRPHSLFVDPAYAASDGYRDFWRRLNAGEALSAEYRRLGKGGREVWIQASYTPVFDLRGAVARIVKFATDVTPRVRAVHAIGDGLSQLALNNLAYTIDERLQPQFETLRDDYNRAAAALRAAIGGVGAATDSVAADAGRIAQASDELSRRTAQQTASLDQTSAALETITEAVRRSAVDAEAATGVASAARDEAGRSGAVMKDGMASMAEIEASSRQISQIIGVIDEIAFQTNLLALNAGVEAARAGDAGKGFAVVAQEVRALAQRSASAAREIGALISSSSAQVECGVQQVFETGEALERIATRVTEIDRLIDDIARSARAEAAGLDEVHRAMDQMQRATLQNAAMVEEATAVSSQLTADSAELRALVREFAVEAAVGPRRLRATG